MDNVLGTKCDMIYQMQDWDIETLKQKIERKFPQGRLNLEISLQRDFVWDEQDQIDLIDTIITGRYVPPILINNSSIGELEVLDGKQRLTTIMNFINGNFSIMIKNKEYYFTTFSDVDKGNFMSYTPFRAAVYQNLSNSDKTSIFVMIQKGKKLEVGEIIHGGVGSSPVSTKIDYYMKTFNLEGLKNFVGKGSKRHAHTKYITALYMDICGKLPLWTSDKKRCDFLDDKNNVNVNSLNTMTAIIQALLTSNIKHVRFSICHFIAFCRILLYGGNIYLNDDFISKYIIHVNAPKSGGLSIKNLRDKFNPILKFNNIPEY